MRAAASGDCGASSMADVIFNRALANADKASRANDSVMELVS